MVAESKITEQFIYISTTMKIFFLKPSQDKATVLNCLETAPSPSQHKHLVKCNVLNRLTQDLQLIHELAHRVLQIHYRWRMFIDSLMIFYGFFGFVIFLPNFFSKGCSRGGGGVLVRQGVLRGIPGFSGPVPGVTDTPHVLLLWPFQRKTSGSNVSNVTSEKAALFFRTEYSKRKFVFQFFKAIFDTSFRPSLSFLVNRTYLFKW